MPPALPQTASPETTGASNCSTCSAHTPLKHVTVPQHDTNHRWVAMSACEWRTAQSYIDAAEQRQRTWPEVASTVSTQPPSAASPAGDHASAAASKPAAFSTISPALRAQSSIRQRRSRHAFGKLSLGDRHASVRSSSNSCNGT